MLEHVNFMEVNVIQWKQHVQVIHLLVLLQVKQNIVLVIIKIVVVFLLNVLMILVQQQIVLNLLVHQYKTLLHKMIAI